MKTLTATPETLKQAFAFKYIIPDYQRPYSWGNDECAQLWDDIAEAFDSKPDEHYFCGTIVVYMQNGVKERCIIDGQQRLTTCILLLKALYEQASTFTVLPNYIYVSDEITGDRTQELRIKSLVTANDQHDLKNVLQSGCRNIKKLNLFENNYNLFADRFREWRKNKTPEAINSFILFVLNNVELLPLICEDEDQALIIFNTVNNRGMALSDSDIFKSQLYKAYHTEEDRKNFKDIWDSLNDPLWLFRIYMNIIRANEEKTGWSTEIKLRRFFEHRKFFNNPQKVVEDILKIQNILIPEFSDRSFILFNILKMSPNYFWAFPVYCYLFKYAQYDVDNDSYNLSNCTEFEFLLESLLIFTFSKGIIYNSADKVKFASFKGCVEIMNGNTDFNRIFEKDITPKEKEELLQCIECSDFKKYLRGIVYLASYLNPKQNLALYKNIFGKDTYDIEHILPKQGFNNYDNWTEDQYKDSLWNIGNLVPLEKKKNIQARNFFFRKKQESYQKERNVQDIQDLMKLSDWGYQEFKTRNDEKVGMLKNFFKI